MPRRYAAGKQALGFCDICAFRYPLKKLKPLVIKTKVTNILACPTCWNKDHPQLLLGMYPVDDPQAIRNPRPDNSYWQSGPTGLQIDVAGSYNPISVNSYGTPGEGSRVIQWGWNPVGLHNELGLFNGMDHMEAVGEVGEVTVVCNG